MSASIVTNDIPSLKKYGKLALEVFPNHKLYSLETGMFKDNAPMPRNYIIPVGSVTTKLTSNGSQFASNNLTTIAGSQSRLAAAGSALTSIDIGGHPHAKVKLRKCFPAPLYFTIQVVDNTYYVCPGPFRFSIYINKQ